MRRARAAVAAVAALAVNATACARPGIVATPPAGVVAAADPVTSAGAAPATGTPPPAPSPRSSASAVFRFGVTHSTDEIASTFEALATAHPRWFRAGSLGLSVEGRQLPFLAITDGESTAPKSGFWIDGAIHGGELGSAEPVLGVAELLREAIAANEPPDLLSRVVLYLVPVINVDARRVALEPPYVRQRLNLALVDDDGDGALDEDPPADLNGDGHAMLMWGMLLDGAQSRQIECRDQDGDGRCGEDPLGGIDLNRNFPVARGAQDVEAGPLQPETEAVMRFWLDHPEIELAVSFHTSTEGYVLPPVPIRAEDRSSFQEIAAIYVVGGGGGELTSAQHAVLAPDRLRGTTSEWFYAVRGAIALSIEIEPDSPSFPTARAEHDCLGPVELFAVPPGSAFADCSHLERPVPEVEVRRHARYLIAMAASLPLRG